MTPDLHHAPSGFPEHCVRSFIPRRITRNLSLPIISVALRHPAVPLAAMPETTIHKHGHPLSPEYEIRLSWQRLMAPPAPNPVCPKDSRQFQFGFLITDRTNRGHHFRPLFAREHVRHAQMIPLRCGAVTDCFFHARRMSTLLKWSVWRGGKLHPMNLLQSNFPAFKLTITMRKKRVFPRVIKTDEKMAVRAHRARHPAKDLTLFRRTCLWIRQQLPCVHASISNTELSRLSHPQKPA